MTPKEWVIVERPTCESDSYAEIVQEAECLHAENKS